MPGKKLELRSVKKLQDMLTAKCSNPSDPILKLTMSITQTRNKKAKQHTFVLETNPYRKQESNLTQEILASVLQLAQRYEDRETVFSGVIQQNIESSGKFLPNINLQYSNLNKEGFARLADEISNGFGTNLSKNSQHGVEHWLLEKKVCLCSIQLFQGSDNQLLELGAEPAIL